MALAYYDRTINSPYDLVIAALRESSRPTTLRQLATFVTIKTGFPGEVCHKIITEALEMGMDCGTIRQVGELYDAVPPEPPRLPRRPKSKGPQPKPAYDCCDN
ncbi:uncharacterized protein [Drosophila bipectinata]|uniref:uncharacterized protein n=1 Tax=Drosophila bipectinata TaxID=42026 RepID=UPI001C89F224|nr:uncharacterized protein LOC108130977 [Drosophila bipectinata]